MGPGFRPDLHRITVYEPGKPIDEVSRELGLDDIVKLASNEHPEPPFPEVQEAVAGAMSVLNRYPETSCHRVVEALARYHGLPADRFWVGAGSSQLLGCIALASGGPGTSAVYASPSFVMYEIWTAIAGAAGIEVPLNALQRHDMAAMVEAIAADTTVIYVCNPNNPTGTYVSAGEVDTAIAEIPEDRLVVMDEAYAEYVTAPDYASAIPIATRRRNVVVARTFSKVYGLAGLRIGYLVGHPDTLAAVRRTQPPFSVTSLAQVAAVEALQHEDRLAARVKANADGRDELEQELADRGLSYVPSQTNFVLFTPPGDADVTGAAMLREGVIVRAIGPWIRVSVGTHEENQRFVAALDTVIADS